MSIKPITPNEVVAEKKKNIPDYVFESFNTLIAKNFDGRSSRVKQSDVVKLIKQKGKISEDSIFEHHLLDVEDIYREAGWKVVYDKPAYCESYEASFEFTPKKG